MAACDLLWTRSNSWIPKRRRQGIYDTSSNPPEAAWRIIVRLNKQHSPLEYTLLRTVSGCFENEEMGNAMCTYTLLLKEYKGLEIRRGVPVLIKLKQATQVPQQVPGIEMRELPWLALSASF